MDLASRVHPNVHAAVVRSDLQAYFTKRLKRVAPYAEQVLLVSPWITDPPVPATSLATLVGSLHRNRVPTYVITRPPESRAHAAAVDILKDCPSTEIVFNKYLHAKLYVCSASFPYGFAVLGSANLTANAAFLYEIGIVISSSGGGTGLIREYLQFGLTYLRTRPESAVYKPRYQKGKAHV